MVCILVAVRSSTADVLKDQLQRRLICFFFFFKQKTAYEMRISDWSSDVCSSDLARAEAFEAQIAALKDAKEQLSAQFSEIGGDRKSVVQGKSVSVRVDLGGRRIIKNKILQRL